MYWQFFKPFIDKEIEKGNLARWFFTNFEDVNSMIHNRNQIYGTDPQYLIYPIKDIDNVDKKRKEVSLPPLMYMNYIYGYPLPNGYNMKSDQMIDEMKSRLKND